MIKVGIRIPTFLEIFIDHEAPLEYSSTEVREMVYGYIYIIRNMVNNKLYIGQTTLTFERRYGYNINKNTHNKHLQNSIEKYGIENFSIVESFDRAYSKDELDALEDMYIKIYETTNPECGYNKKYGGSNGRHTEETKAKISENQFGSKNAFFGRHHSEEAKEKIRRAHLGNTVWKGRCHTQESKEKISASKKGQGAKGKNPRARKVICLNTGQIFNCANDAGEYSGRKGKVNPGSAIRQCCKGDRKTSGVHPITGERLKWMYYDEYILTDRKET